MTFLVSEPADVLYAYGYAAVSDVVISYAYEQQDLAISDADMVYRYNHDNDRWERQIGWWAWSTQEISNHFPKWNMVRLNIGGQSQQLVNAWGMSTDLVSEGLTRFKKELFIETAELDQPDIFFYGPTVDYQGQPEKQRDKNMLRNPSFSLAGLARRKTPLWWSTGRALSTGTVQLVNAPAFIGTHSVRLHAEEDESAYLYQTVLAALEARTNLTISLWYMVPIPADLLVEDERRAGISVSLLYADGTVEIERAALQLGTDGRWRLQSISIELEKELHSFTFGIQVENDGPEAIRVYAGAAQAERGSVATPWSDFPFTSIPYLTEDVVVGSPVDAYINLESQVLTEEVVTGEPVSYAARAGRTLHYVPDTWRLWYDTIPSRAIVHTGELPVHSQRTQLGWFANEEKERFSTAWRITGNYIEQYNREIPGEEICQFRIGEFHLDEDGRTQVGILDEDEDENFTRELETLCVIKSRLWVVCKETEDGVTTRVVKILNPHSRWPIPLAYEQELEDLHLECIGDFELDMTTGSATYLGVSEDDPDVLVMQVGDDFHLINLEYDYYHFDRVRAQAVLRTDHGGQLATL